MSYIIATLSCELRGSRWVEQFLFVVVGNCDDFKASLIEEGKVVGFRVRGVV